jgi:hypothetical protein
MLQATPVRFSDFQSQAAELSTSSVAAASFTILLYFFVAQILHLAAFGQNARFSGHVLP